VRRRYFMRNGRLMVQEQPGVLVKCQIPGCDEIMPEEEQFVHEIGHPDPVHPPEPKSEPVLRSTNEEGVYSLTSMSER
jgi:hypothetical protein